MIYISRINVIVRVTKVFKIKVRIRERLAQSIKRQTCTEKSNKYLSYPLLMVTSLKCDIECQDRMQ